MRLFHRIRRKLLQNDEFTRYLKYALGELVLVVLGILIALQINNWNNQRQSDTQSKALLVALKLEIEGNQKLLAIANKNYHMILDATLGLSEHFSPEVTLIDEQSLDQFISSSGWFPGYSPRDAVYQSTLSTGQTSLIKNKEIIYNLSSLASEMDTYSEIYSHIGYVSSSFTNELIADYPIRNMNTGEMSAKSRSKFPVNQQAILSNRRVEHWVDLKRLNVISLIAGFENIHKLQDTLIQQIEKEILKY